MYKQPSTPPPRLLSTMDAWPTIQHPPASTSPSHLLPPLLQLLEKSSDVRPGWLARRQTHANFNIQYLTAVSCLFPNSNPRTGPVYWFSLLPLCCLPLTTQKCRNGKKGFDEWTNERSRATRFNCSTNESLQCKIRSPRTSALQCGVVHSDHNQLSSSCYRTRHHSQYFLQSVVGSWGPLNRPIQPR